MAAECYTLKMVPRARGPRSARYRWDWNNTRWYHGAFSWEKTKENVEVFTSLEEAKATCGLIRTTLVDALDGKVYIGIVVAKKYPASEGYYATDEEVK